MTSAYALTPDQVALCDRVRRLARTQLLPLVESGTPGRVNRPLLAAMGEHGLLGLMFPDASPGAQAAAMDLCLLRETLATVSTDAETALALQGLGTYPLVQSGRPAVVARWLPEVAAGRAVAAFALTEPGAGSDAASLAMHADADGDGWRLTGEKVWISNAPEADFYTVFARTGDAPGARGVSAFVVPGDREGLIGEALDLLGSHPIGRLHFDGVRVEPDELLGEVGSGFGVAMATLDLFRFSVGACAVGMAQAALDTALVHVSQRRAFGGVLADLQSVGHKLAAVATRVEAARLLVHSAASAYDAGDRDDITMRAAMAKLFATETAQEAVDAAIQVHGACALERGHLLEHLYRDVRATRIYEGASEVQLTIIARELRRRAESPDAGGLPT